MIDKRSGQVKYAVLSFGGFLGIGDEYYPLPWQSLTYDESLGGYVANVTEDKLKGAPKYSDESGWNGLIRARASKPVLRGLIYLMLGRPPPGVLFVCPVWS